MHEKLIPHNDEAECILLALLLKTPESFGQITGLLAPDDFYTEANRIVYETVLLLQEKKRMIDIITIQSELEKQGKMQSHEEYYSYSRLFHDLMQYYPSPSDNILEYAHMLREISLYREAIIEFTHLVGLAWNQDSTMMQVAIETVKALENRSSLGSQAFSPMESIASPYIEIISKAYQLRGALSGIDTGFHDINRLTQGWQDSDFIVFAARPGVGKTTFSLNLTLNAAKRGCHVGYFSMEMSKFQLFNKMVAMGAPMDSQRLIRGTFEDDDWSKIITTTEQLATQNISICDRSGLTIQELTSLARTLHANHPVDIFFVDYIQLMRSNINGKRREHREQEVSDIAQGLKNLARDLHRPVIALAQLSRDVEKRVSKIPLLSDLRESGSIEQEADIVGLFYRDDLYDPDSERKNIVDIIFAKHRNGPTGEVSLYFDNRTSRFMDLMVTPPTE